MPHPALPRDPASSLAPHRVAGRTRVLGLIGIVGLFLLVFPLSADAFNYVTTNNGEQWGVQDDAAPDVDTGSIRETTSNALQGFGGIRVKVSTATTPAWSNGALMRGFGLEFQPPNQFATTRSINLGGVEIARYVKIDVSAASNATSSSPAIPANWGRWLDEFKNTTDAPVTVTVDFGGQTGLGATTKESTVQATSAGGTTITPGDSWVEVAGVPTTGTNAGIATIAPSAVVLGTPAPYANAITGVSDFLNDDFGDDAPTTGNDSNFRGYQNTFTLQPGQVESLVHFVVVGTSETAATAGTQVSLVQTEAAELAANPSLSDLAPSQICSIINFDVSTLTIPGFSDSSCPQQPALTLPAAPAPNPTTTSSPYNVVGKSIDQEEKAMEDGVTTSQQITQAYLDRIAAYDRGQFGFNSYITVNQQAIAEAKAADAARAAGATGPLLGIPLTVKDLYETDDMPTTDGALTFEGYMASYNATQVQDLENAGAVILGKASMEEYATSGYYSDSAYGQVWNAFDPSRSSIASSGGTAVAIATSLAAGGLGTETGDSLYGPASAAGLVALRGTDGLASSYGVMPLEYLQDYPGAIARTVPDLADLEDVTTGTDSNDPLTAAADDHRPADWRSYLSPNALQGKVIGYYASAFVDPNGTTDVTSAEMAAFQYFTDAGATMKLLTGPPPSPSSSSYPTGTGDENYEGWYKWIQENPNNPYTAPAQIIGSQLKLPFTRELNGYQGAGLPTEQQSTNWAQERADYKTDIENYMDSNGVDAVVYPGLLSDISLNDGGSASFGRSDTPSGSSGDPTMIFPAGVDSEGDPIDLQLLGRQWSDPELLGYAYAFEQVATPAGHGYVTLGGTNTGGYPELPNTAPALTYVPGSTSPPVTEPAAPVAPTTSPAGGTTTPTTTNPITKAAGSASPHYSVKLVKLRSKLARKKTFAVKLTCDAPGAPTCTTDLLLKSGSTIVATKTITVKSDRQVTIKLTLDKAGTRLLAAGKLRTATLSAAIGDAYGLHVTKEGVTFKAPRAKKKASS
jgi:amidase